MAIARVSMELAGFLIFEELALRFYIRRGERAQLTDRGGGR